MFLKIGNDYINTAQIKRIRPFVKQGDRGHYVSVEMVDGLKFEGYCTEDRVASLTRHYLPAPAGIEITLWTGNAEQSIVDELRTETLVGFAYDGYNDLSPVTVESGVVDSPYNLKFPNGRVRSSWGEEFKSEADMLAEAAKRSSRAA